MKKLLPLIILLLVCSIARAQIITTVAGGGTVVGGDGGMATNASLKSLLAGLAVDGVGNIYFCERDANQVRRVSPTGTITTFAGTGVGGYDGDGGLATAAKLKGPYSIVVDGLGNVYIGDESSSIRKVGTTGFISTFAGTGVAGYDGDGGPATNAKISVAHGLALDAGGNMYFADIENNRIRRISADGIISTIAGTGVSTYNGDNIPATNANLFSPSGVAVDQSGNVFVTDSRNQRIRKIDNTGMITTVAGVGTAGYSGDGFAATSAQLKNPMGICTDKSGSVFFSDVLNDRVRKVDIDGQIATVAGNGLSVLSGDGGPATSAGVPTPIGLAQDAVGNMYICSFDRIRKVSGLVSVTTHPKEYSVADIQMFPNPTNSEFTIKTTFHPNYNVFITDMLGRVVLVRDCDPVDPVAIRLNVPNGVYVVTAIIDGVHVSSILNIKQ